MSSLPAQTLPLQHGYHSGRLPAAGAGSLALPGERGELTGLDERRLENKAVAAPRKLLTHVGGSAWGG